MAPRFRYAPLSRIASGGTATVFVGARSRMRAPELVALKRPHAHILEDPKQRAEVLREARVAASLRHPNVVAVREVETVGDEVQLVMDYVEGAALGSLIALEARRDRRIPTGIALRIVLDACEGLAAVHAQTDANGRLLGLVHRDVSPQNILVGVDGRARLTDFGLARAVYAGAPSTTQGTLKGKLGYMAPEYVNRGQVDRAVDVFAMGVVLWETLAGRRLFRGDNEAQTLARVLRDDPATLDSVAPELAPSAALDAIIHLATEKEPDRRLPSGIELRDAVARAVTGVVATQAEVGSYVQQAVGDELATRAREVRAGLRARRLPLWMALGAAALAASGTAAAIAMHRDTPATPPLPSTSPSSTAPSTSTSTTTPTPTPSVGSSLLRRHPPVPLALSLTSLLRKAALLRPPGRTGRSTGRGDVEPVSHPLAEAVDRQPTVTTLGPLVVDDDPQLGSDPVEQPRPLAGTQRRGPGNVEAQFDTGVHLVGVLAARPSARRELELQLAQGNQQ